MRPGGALARAVFPERYRHLRHAARPRGNELSQHLARSTAGWLVLIAGFMAPSAVDAQPAGSRPQLPLSLPLWQRLQKNPSELNGLGATLPPVAAEPGPDKNIQQEWLRRCLSHSPDSRGETP